MTEIHIISDDDDDMDWDTDLRVTYRDEPFTGIVETRDELGRLLKTAEYYGGIQHGIERKFYPDGQIKSELKVEVGITVGPVRRWYANGQLESEATFVAG